MPNLPDGLYWFSSNMEILLKVADLSSVYHVLSLFFSFWLVLMSCALSMNGKMEAKFYEQAITSSPTNEVLFSLRPWKTEIGILGGFFWLMACLLCCFLCDLQYIWWGAVCWILRVLFMGFFPQRMVWILLSNSIFWYCFSVKLSLRSKRRFLQCFKYSFSFHALNME